MSTHFIVTCGTSQIQQDKIVKLQKLHREKFHRIREDSRSISDDEIDRITGDLTPSTIEHCEYNALTEQLRPRWSAIESELKSPDSNCFGGEISTLFKMQESKIFDPSADQITLLYSDTKAGVFCAAVIKAMLEWDGTLPEGKRDDSAWKMKGRAEAVHVSGLREEVPEGEQEVNKIESSLVKAINSKWKEGQPTGIVMTGGFKSVIPYLTIYMLTHNFQLYYLFEKSTNLRVLKLPVNVPRKLSFMEQLVNVFRRNKIENAIFDIFDHAVRHSIGRDDHL